jgi:putative acetyltransferase
MNEKEINKIMSIWKDATIKAHQFISEDYWLRNYNVVKEQYIPIAKTYVYIEGNEIKGFISIINEEFIGALFVDVNCQGNGIGSKLIEYVKGIYDYLELSVYKENEASVYFYKKVGFTIMREDLNEDTDKVEYVMSFKKI